MRVQDLTLVLFHNTPWFMSRQYRPLHMDYANVPIGNRKDIRCLCVALNGLRPTPVDTQDFMMLVNTMASSLHLFFAPIA